MAYEFQKGDAGEGIPRGLLKADTAIIFNTSNTPEEREMNVFGDPLETLWKNCIFSLCGVKNVYRRVFGIIVTSSQKQRTTWLREVDEAMDRYFPLLKVVDWILDLINFPERCRLRKTIYCLHI